MIISKKRFQAGQPYKTPSQKKNAKSALVDQEKPKPDKQKDKTEFVIHNYFCR